MWQPDTQEKIICETAQKIVEQADALKLSIPMNKRMHIGSDPVSFLGYLLNHDFQRPLSRNQKNMNDK